jgi:hypothetical protein
MAQKHPDPAPDPRRTRWTICGKLSVLVMPILSANVWYKYNSPFQGVSEGFVDMRKDMFTYFLFPLPHGKNCLLLSFMSNISQHLYGTCFYIKKFFNLHKVHRLKRKRKQQMNLRKGTENATEPICCLFFKGSLTNALVSTCSSYPHSTLHLTQFLLNIS